MLKRLMKLNSTNFVKKCILLLLTVVSCSDFAKLKSKHKTYYGMISYEEFNENMLILLTDSFIYDIKSKFLKIVDNNNFLSEAYKFKDNFCDCEFKRAIFPNYLILNHIQNSKHITLELIDFIKDNFENIDFCKTGYNLLHLAVYLKDLDMFIKYFNKDNLYSNGINDSPRVTPLQALFLLNLSNENRILDFLQGIDSVLDKEVIERNGLLILACRFIMPKVANHLISKGASVTKEYIVDPPMVKGNPEIARKVKNYKVSFTPFSVGSSAIFIDHKNILDPLEIIFSSNILFFYQENGIVPGFIKGNKSYSEWIPNIYLRIMYDLYEVFEKIVLDRQKCFEREYETDTKKDNSLLSKYLFNNVRDDEWGHVRKMITESDIEYQKFCCLVSNIEYKVPKKIDKESLSEYFKYHHETIMEKGKEDDLSLVSQYNFNNFLNEGLVNIDFVKININSFCEYLTKKSTNNLSNKLFLSFLFEIYRKDIVSIIEEGYFSLARLLVRFPEEFNISKNKIYSRRTKAKNKKNKRKVIKETLYDKINNLKNKKDINKEELEETIYLARDKGWMTQKEVIEIKDFEDSQKRLTKKKKNRNLFKDLNKIREKKEGEIITKVENKESKEKNISEKKEEIVVFDNIKYENHLSLNEDEVKKEFNKLVFSDKKDELILLLNKFESKMDKNFKIAESTNEGIRQLLIIRGFFVDKHLILSIMENNQKKAMKTLLREVAADIKLRVFDFNKEEVEKIEITKEMKSILGGYGKDFKVIKEESKSKRKEEKKKIEYEIYTIEEIDKESKSYLFDKEFKDRSSLALQNMKIGRGDTKKIYSKDNLFEYRMIGHVDEGNIRIYYKQEGIKKIILKISYKGENNFNTKDVNDLESIIKNYKNFNKIEI